MHLLDPRLDSCSMLHSVVIHIISVLFVPCRFRVPRPSILNAAQWNAVLTIFYSYVPRFFPNNRISPVFVPLLPDLAMFVADLKDDIPVSPPPPLPLQKPKQIQKPEQKSEQQLLLILVLA